jgi:hypothetical protein
LYNVVCKGVSLQHTTSTIYTHAKLCKDDKTFQEKWITGQVQRKFLK